MACRPCGDVGGASPASRTALFQKALALVTIDGILHARRAFGDAAEPVRLHQGEIEILITLGSRAATDGCRLGRGVQRDRDLIHCTQVPGYNDSENG